LVRGCSGRGGLVGHCPAVCARATGRGRKAGALKLKSKPTPKRRGVHKESRVLGIDV